MNDLQFLILGNLVRETTGRDLARILKKEHGKSVSYGRLYTILRRMGEAGWVTKREAEDEDGRFRYFRISAEGYRAFQEERARCVERGEWATRVVAGGEA